MLHGLDLDIAPGETHAIVGATGAGKSTVVKLLLRLYEPSAGLDHHRRGAHRRAHLRAPSAARSASSARTCSCSRAPCARTSPTAGPMPPTPTWCGPPTLAEAHTFISALPDGYDTIVGERGQKLSGGQRQRLTIARAILRDPAILVLDEATSAVDNETEAAIQRSLARVSAGPHHDRHRPPALHRPPRPPDPRARGRRGDRGRHPRGARRSRRPLRRPLARPDRRSRHDSG